MDQELISLLYVGEKNNSDLPHPFSKANGFSLVFWDIAGHKGREGARTRPDLIFPGVDIPGIHRPGVGLPDIILIDDPGIKCMDPSAISVTQEWIGLFDDLSSGPKPAFFLGVDRVPEPDMRITLQKVDEFIVRPFSPVEVAHRARVYLEKKNLEQKQAVQNQTLKKAFAYLDKFKQELKVTKKELIAEKNSLNNALKQIHHLTHERVQMKKSNAQIRESLHQNLEGFGRLLSILIRTRVDTNRGHGDRVAHIARFIGKQFDFDEKKLDDLGKAAMLHEIGLLFMSEEALEKDKKELSKYEQNIWTH